jgi:hypothetical protein
VPADPRPVCPDSRSIEAIVGRHLPGLYDIVSRGGMPAIVFHKDSVELLYHARH